MTALRAILLMSLFMLSCPKLCSAQTGIFAAGSRHLYLHCEGNRHGPVVILSTGLYREASDWRLIMPEIARFTQVCGYDREGLGQSTVDDDPARLQLPELPGVTVAVSVLSVPFFSLLTSSRGLTKLDVYHSSGHPVADRFRIQPYTQMHFGKS